MFTFLRIMMQCIVNPTNHVGEAIIISNEFTNNQDKRREGAHAEKRKLEKVFIHKLKFEYLNETLLNGDITSKLWDHTATENPMNCEPNNPRCIQCLIRCKANASTKYFLLAICSHGRTHEGDLHISLGDVHTDDQTEPSTKRKRVASAAETNESIIKLGDIIRYLKECEQLRSKTVIIIIETCRATGFSAESEDRGVHVLVAADQATGSSDANPQTAQEATIHYLANSDSDVQATDTNVRPVLPGPVSEQQTPRSQETDYWALPVGLPKNYIILFGTTSFRVSYRHTTEGSWLEHALLQEINQYVAAKCKTLNFLQFLTKVASNVAKRQVPQMKSSTTANATLITAPFVAEMSEEEPTPPDSATDPTQPPTISLSNVVPEKVAIPCSKCSIQIAHCLTEPIIFNL